MLLYTSDNLPRKNRTSIVEQRRERLSRWIADQTANSVYIDDPQMDPTNAFKRMGQPLLAEEVERRLKKMNPSLVFEWNQFNSTKKMIYLVDRQGKKALFPYESGLIPERSIMNAIEEYVPVSPDIFDNPDFKTSRKDLDLERGPDGNLRIKDAKNPYMKRVLVPGFEIKRGWRTMLIKLVACGVITPAQAELSFGSADNPEWQNSMGKSKHLLPW